MTAVAAVTATNAKHQLAGLAVVEAVVDIAMRALLESFHELDREPRPEDPAETVTAGELVGLCAQLLATIDAHRCHLARYLDPDDHHWPF